MIHIDDITKSFDDGRSFAVRGVSLRVAQGETVVLLGASGCGKTTLLKLINRLIEPTSGRVEIDGRDVATVDPLELRRGIGYIFQDIGLFPHMSVSQNVEITPRLTGGTARTRSLLEAVGLDPDRYADRRPRELSGGQQQRVGIARALAGDPDILLMDEPFGALDAVTREQLQTELARIKRELDKTIIFVTHDIFEAVRLGDRIAVMRDGVIEQVGEAERLIREPATEFVGELFDHARRQAERLTEIEP
ncbi:MAG: ATP-binding cassette domain-containing protein [Planctomycetota bacterium]|nr:MAG: ATP-binding cassette domain-containing protein [Planctomycetota bacterium]